MRRLTIIILLAAAAGMVSCSAVRHCQAPDVDLPERIAGEDSDSLTVADVQWWRFYGDSTLCRIIERTLDNNRDMLAAAARVERLRELYRVSRAERLPSVTGTAYGDYETNDYAGEKSGSWICGATCAGPNAKGAPNTSLRSRTGGRCA